jgi:hypothetical protein
MSDGDCLQESLFNLNVWSHENNIKCNASKCKVLSVTRKKNPVTYNYHLGPSSLLRVRKEKDLGIIVTDNLLWNTHIQMITAKANKMLGLLKRTCPLLTETKIRRSLYLSLVKIQLCYGTEIWSPSNLSLKIKIERIQRRATRWILRSRIGELSYKERLQTLDMLPLCYVREIQDLVFFYKALHGYVDVDISNYVSFINHHRSRLTLNPSLLLQVPLCRTTTFKNSYFNRTVHLWNSVCRTALPNNFWTLSSFKNFLHRTYSSLRNSVFEVDMPCTWSLVRDCPCHRN